jgi:murein DD-endopeptidase MepM/ murein hydrolase activator NlpD
MLNYFRIIFFVLLYSFSMETFAQSNVWRDIYKVKKKDTLYGIATHYGLTVEDLIEANPDFKDPKFKLKKGDMVFIPNESVKKSAGAVSNKINNTPNKKEINVGVMLPLHDVDGDGKRMVEYYRGLLIGCDSLRELGINTKVHAWNVAIDDDIRVKLLEQDVKRLDIIFGPLYSKQVKPLADFCRTNNIKLVIPFSITSSDVITNPNIFQVYQNDVTLTSRAIKAFLERFKDCNPIFVDCNDATSNKGSFTFGLRKQLETKGISYQITNLNSSLESFNKAFVKGKRNVIILNTGRSPELNLAFRKLNELTASVSGYDISMFGYTEWLQYESTYRELYHKYDTYVPSTFYYYKGLSRVAAFEQNYKKWFGEGLQERYIPRFAITGFDHAQYFIRGIYESGNNFKGTYSESNYKAIQTPLRFTEASSEGGRQNNVFQLVHYRNDGVIATVSY